MALTVDEIEYIGRCFKIILNTVECRSYEAYEQAWDNIDKITKQVTDIKKSEQTVKKIKLHDKN